MCGRYTLHCEAEDVRLHFALDWQLADYQPRYNIAPSQPIWVVDGRGSERRARQVIWGFSAVSRHGAPLINARSETAAELPTFREAMHARRCLVPASGYVEWSQMGKLRQPHWFRRRDGQLLALAGVLEAPGETQGCVLLTTAANELVAEIHHRMPVIVPSSAWEAWLDPATPLGDLGEVLMPCRAADMEAIALTTRINAATLDDPACLEPARQLRLF